MTTKTKRKYQKIQKVYPIVKKLKIQILSIIIYRNHYLLNKLQAAQSESKKNRPANIILNFFSYPLSKSNQKHSKIKNSIDNSKKTFKNLIFHHFGGIPPGSRRRVGTARTRARGHPDLNRLRGQIQKLAIFPLTF